ncbi:MAG: hypothetical protein ACQERN_10855, partial [Thermodesulfobacteriota bacterium]
LSSDITDESTEIVADAGREQLLEKAKDVALQCEIYLRAHPDLEPEDYSYDPEFSEIAVQAVGETGYTSVIGEELEDRDSVIWAHPNPNLIGIPDTDTLRKALGPYFDEFYSVLEGSWGRNVSTGHYMWKDTDGKLREKYMAIAPIELGEDNPPLSVLATAYMDEFTQKTEDLRKDAEQMATETRNINLGIIGGAIVIIGLCIIIYGYRLSRRKRSAARCRPGAGRGARLFDPDAKPRQRLRKAGQKAGRLGGRGRYCRLFGPAIPVLCRRCGRL